MHRIKLKDGRRRRITVREAASYKASDWFNFSGKQTSKYNQIGNAVAPNFSYHLANSIKEYFMIISNIRFLINNRKKYNLNEAVYRTRQVKK